MSKAKLSVRAKNGQHTHATLVQRHEAVGNFGFDTRRTTLFISYTGTCLALVYHFNTTQKGAIFLIFDNFFFRWDIKR